MRVFVITPVRRIAPDFREKVSAYVDSLLADGHQVYYPPKDTPQDDLIGLVICSHNREAIRKADEVHVAWDGASTGCLFDLGMSFALGKPIHLIPGCFPSSTEGKSFASMVRAWAGE